MCMGSSSGLVPVCSDSDEQPGRTCSRVLRAVCQRLSRDGRRALAIAVVAATALAVPGAVFAQEGEGGSTSGPDFGISAQSMLDVVEGRLSSYLGPFMIFSIGLCAVMLVWGVVKGFARGRA